jgi:hypothetical protein
MDIKIDIKDDRHFIDVASIVDRDDFVDEIKRLRSVFVKILPKNFPTKPPNEEIEKRIDDEIEKSRKSLFLPLAYSSVISAVAFRNEVTDMDYSPAYLVKKTGSFYTGMKSYHFEDTTPDETYSIILTPSARDKDVLKAFKEYRDKLGNTNDLFQFVPLIWDRNKKKPSIKYYRKWYLASKSGKEVKDIADEETENCLIKTVHENKGKKKPKDCSCFDESTISKGIKTYKKLLLKSPTL